MDSSPSKEALKFPSITKLFDPTKPQGKGMAKSLYGTVVNSFVPKKADQPGKALLVATLTVEPGTKLILASSNFKFVNSWPRETAATITVKSHAGNILFISNCSFLFIVEPRHQFVRCQ